MSCTYSLTQKRVPFKEIIKAIGLLALNLEYHDNKADAESLHHIFNKSRNITIKDKLSKDQRKALREIQQINKKSKVYPFDKGTGFVILSEGDVIKKVGKQLGKAKATD